MNKRTNRKLELQALTIAIIIHAALLFGYGVVFGVPVVYAETKKVKIRLGGGGLDLGLESNNYSEMTALPRKVTSLTVNQTELTQNISDFRAPVKTAEPKKEDKKNLLTREEALAKIKISRKPDSEGTENKAKGLISMNDGNSSINSAAKPTGTGISAPGGQGLENVPAGPGSPYGNAIGDGEEAARDYLELLQYTVQENSFVSGKAKSLRGTAVIRITFTRSGTVTNFTIQKRTGKRALDDAVIQLGERLKTNGFPRPPTNFDAGDYFMKYDFLVRYPPKEG